MIKSLIDWFERHNKISWLITLLIAIVIFYISSLTFEAGAPGPQFKFKSYLYHFFAFFFLAFFLIISLVKGKRHNKKLIFFGVIIAIVYGVSDEIHQLFVPGRQFSVIDILTDSLGIMFVGILYSLRFRSHSRLIL